MEKDQVTFVVQAPVTRRPLPDIIFYVGMAVSEAGIRFDVMSRSLGQWINKTSFDVPPGLIDSSRADLIAQAVGDSFYNFMLNRVGIQGSFESLP